MYFEIFKQGKLIKRGTTVLGNISWNNELMGVPECELTLPAEYAEFFDGREDVKIHVNGKVFWGHLKNNYTLNKTDETISLPLSHIVSEWEYRQISVNHAIADGNITAVFKGDKVSKNTGNQEGITANDFGLRNSDVSDISNARLIKKAYAQAWSLVSGDPVPITKVDRSNLKKKDGTYKVTFSTAKGTSVTVNCEVNANVEVGGLRSTSNRAVKEKITARRFSIDITNVPELDDDEIKKISKVKAWKMWHPSVKYNVNITRNTIQNEIGDYSVTFTTETGNTSLTIEVSVRDLSGTAVSTEPTVIDTLDDIYNDMNMAYPGWQIDWQDDSEDRLIDYVYSRQSKLEALTKTMEITPDLYWRVGFTNEKLIEVGKFGDKKPYTISVKPSGKTNRRMITEPEVTPDYENVINVATVYSDKSDGGMSSLTLREVYGDTGDDAIEALKKNFPVVILRANVNNERDYTKYVTQFPKLAPNNELEYAVLDKESIALESGILIEGTFAFNDIGAFSTEGKKITDARRIKAAKTVYRAAVRKLRESRRNYRFTVTVEEMPPDVNVGDKIRVLYDNSIWHLEACSNYWKKILQMDDYFYIESMEWEIEANGKETNNLTLVKYLKIERETNSGW